VLLTDFEKRLHDADIVICSTEAPHFLVSNEAVRHALAARRNRPMLFIDISVPRNIDPSISNLDNVFLFDIDDLENVVSFNRTEREREALRAEAIVDSEVKRFAESLGDGGINEVIGAFRREVSVMVEMELDRSRKRLGPLTMDQEEALRTLVNSIVRKLTLPAIKQLRESDDGYSRYIEEWRDLNQRNRQG
jgi:glutamyl-tRNA reductase